MAGALNAQAELGFAYAFAKSRQTGAPIVHNELTGAQMMIDGMLAIEYSVNPYVFLGIGDPGAPTDVDGDGLRDLDDVEYSSAPDELLFPRFIAQGNGVTSRLVLLNLTGGSLFDATVDILLYNDNEVVFSRQYTFRCWTQVLLDQISPAFSQATLALTDNDPDELLGAPGMETGWFRVDGSVANSTAASFRDPAIVGFLVESVRGFTVADLPFERGCQTNGDLYAVTILGDLVN